MGFSALEFQNFRLFGLVFKAQVNSLTFVAVISALSVGWSEPVRVGQKSLFLVLVSQTHRVLPTSKLRSLAYSYTSDIPTRLSLSLSYYL